jgi:hypothetical protein
LSLVDTILDDVRSQIEPSGVVLCEARSRLANTRAAAASFYGSLRTYRSGSLAVHTMNEPVTDGDGGLVLNRNYYPSLGPDGMGDSPGDIVDELCAHLGSILRETYPDARVHKSKRGPKIHFGAEVEGQDPTVDMVVAMNRKDGPGIWIPNLKTGEWEASDPEGHVELLNYGQSAFRSTRRKVTRLAKAWNKQFYAPGVSSFEISVWAYEFVTPGLGVAKGLYTLFDGAATRLESGDPTADPAGASADLKLLKEASTVAARLRKAANALAVALHSDSDAEVLEAMSVVFFRYIDAPHESALQNAVQQLGTGTPVSAAALGVQVAATTSPSRSYGGHG